VGIGKASASESPSTCRNQFQVASELGRARGSRMSLAETRLLARRCPAYRRREPGLRLSRGTWEGWPRYRRLQGGERERAQAGGTCEALSTVAGLAFGPVRSSDEAPVMGVERRSRTVLVKFVRATRGFWEGSSGRAEVEGEAL
jgi:hypothetical protein